MGGGKPEMFSTVPGAGIKNKLAMPTLKTSSRAHCWRLFILFGVRLGNAALPALQSDGEVVVWESIDIRDSESKDSEETA